MKISVKLLEEASKQHMLKKYYHLFQNLDLSAFRDTNYAVGISGHSRHAMMRALIFRALENIHSIPKLIYFIEGNRALAEIMGFSGKLPDSSQFYRFLKETNNRLFRAIFIFYLIFYLESSDLKCLMRYAAECRILRSP